MIFLIVWRPSLTTHMKRYNLKNFITMLDSSKYQKYLTMSTAKLRALLETTTPGDRAIITEILKERGEGHEMAPNGAESPVPQPVPPTDAEIKALAAELRAKYKGCPCQVVPGDGDEWVDGTVASIMEGLRSGTVFYSIITADGRRVIKRYDSDQVRVTTMKNDSDEPQTKRTYNRIRAEDWSPAEAISNARRYVGCLMAVDLGPGVGLKAGRVVAILPNNKNHSILLRIHIPDPTPENSKAYKEVHRAIHDNIAFVTDEHTEEVRNKYMERVKLREKRERMDPDQRLRLCEENLRKAEAALLRAQEILKLRQDQLEEAKNELLNTLDNENRDIKEG